MTTGTKTAAVEGSLYKARPTFPSLSPLPRPEVCCCLCQLLLLAPFSRLETELDELPTQRVAAGPTSGPGSDQSPMDMPELYLDEKDPRPVRPWVRLEAELLERSPFMAMADESLDDR